MPALLTLTGILQRVQIARATERDGPQSDADPLLVHHVEHVRQALVGFTDQLAATVAIFAELEEAIDRAAIAHLVVESGHAHVVVGAATAIFGNPILGHSEQADSAHASRRVRQAGQHHVHDVLAQFVVAGRNPHLRAFDTVAALPVRNRPGTQIGQ